MSGRVLERTWPVTSATDAAAAHLMAGRPITVVIDGNYGITTPEAPDLIWHTKDIASDARRISGTVSVGSSTWQFVIVDGTRPAQSGKPPKPRMIGILHSQDPPPHPDGRGGNDDPGVWESESVGPCGGSGET